MRLFIGITIPESIKQEISTWQKKHKSIPFRTVPSSNLHVTLVAPWNAKDEKCAREVLQEFQWERGGIEIEIDEIIPKKSLVWAQITENRKLSMLRKRLHVAFRKKEEHRKHKFHITLARYQYAKITRDMRRRMKEKVGWNAHLMNVHLYKSELYQAGACHTSLESISLKQRESLHAPLQLQ